MTGILMTAYDGAILGPIARLLGWIMNGIYMLMYNLFGIENIGLSIILLTIVIYMCLLPLTIKQQKFSKLSQKMQPEIQAIQAKYKNKKDQASMQAMNEETQMVYQKYGVSPTGSCVQLLIQMPILFALYRVFYNVPAYVSSVKNTFEELVNGVVATEGFADKMQTIMTDFNMRTVKVDWTATGDTLNNYIVDVLYKVPSTGWNKVIELFPGLEGSINETVSHVDKFNYFLGLNISDTPWNIIKTNWAAGAYGFVVLALLIPICSYLTQVLNIKLMPQATSENGQADQMAASMKTMNMMMPLMSLFLCFTVPVGLGIYWVISALVRVFQQIVINKHIENLDLDEVIKKNQEKRKKKLEKMGISENQIRDAARMNTRSISSKANMSSFAEKEMELEKANAKKANAKEGSMAAKANMVRDFNERNSHK